MHTYIPFKLCYAVLVCCCCCVCFFPLHWWTISDDICRDTNFPAQDLVPLDMKCHRQIVISPRAVSNFFSPFHFLHYHCDFITCMCAFLKRRTAEKSHVVLHCLIWTFLLFFSFLFFLIVKRVIKVTSYLVLVIPLFPGRQSCFPSRYYPTRPFLSPLGRIQRTQKLSSPFAKNPELSNVLSFKPGVCESIALHVSPVAKNWPLAVLRLTNELQPISVHVHAHRLKQADRLSKYHCSVNKARGRVCVFYFFSIFLSSSRNNGKVLWGCADRMWLQTHIVLFTQLV